jgi:hypothetical protein
MSHAAALERRTDANGDRCVVVHADDEIWISPELLAEAAEPGKVTVTGGLERDGGLISFGTPGEGLGRLTYRLRPDMVYDANGPGRWYVAERVEAP